MSDASETQPYEASLITESDDLQSKKFARLTDAILWLSAQFALENSTAEQGVIFYEDVVIWRKRNYPLPNENPPLVPGPDVSSPPAPALNDQRDEDLAD